MCGRAGRAQCGRTADAACEFRRLNGRDSGQWLVPCTARGRRCRRRRRRGRRCRTGNWLRRLDADNLMRFATAAARYRLSVLAGVRRI